MFSSLFQFVNQVLFNLLLLLPESPFRSFLVYVDSYDLLGAVNYFIPFDICCTIFETWLTAVSAWIIYRNAEKAAKLFF